MKKALLFTALCVGLMGCADDGGIDQTKLAGLKQAAIDSILLWNAAGVDPLQADTETLMRIGAACGTATAILTVTDFTVPDAPDVVLAFCETAMKAAAPADA